MCLVSIVTPVYNSEKYLADNIASVQAQTHTHWEHILVDDCSNDGSASLIESYQKKDPRIKYYKLESNSGAGVARNKAIELAQGEYIAFLDSDDQWYPTKLEKQLGFMRKNGYHFTFTDYDMINDAGEKLTRLMKAKPVLTYRKALYKNPIGCLTVMYDVGFFGKQYMPSIRKRQDFALWLSLLKRTNGYGLNECLASYRVGNTSISSNKLSLLKYEWQIYREVEGLPLIQSVFYTTSAIVLKLKSYFC
ncbi:glycosyltransferase family 2 protein [Pseudozobellia thermophila]|uniref:Glycosyl transferase family 2 n=1 Tax=Pseudozobellia thermophila TaxID=192903 RepID=A0A1M6BMW9_9FLAO|nr:glycosyltransferase family 2 protein [Pseudozobellia thermophila]SHI50089.1 Glycosyl transferase family 2 [Pseudozobellia thermophila]